MTIEDDSYPNPQEEPDDKFDWNKAIRRTFCWLVEREFLIINGDNVFATKLGEATICSGFKPWHAESCLDDLNAAKKGLNLETDLHLIYLCTPLGTNFTNSTWSYVTEKLRSLPGELHRVAETCQVDSNILKKMSPPQSHSLQRKVEIIYRYVIVCNFILPAAHFMHTFT